MQEMTSFYVENFFFLCPLFMKSYKRCMLCNLLLYIPAHWFAHFHIMLRVANFVKMALQINNLCALWEIFHLESSDNGLFFCSLVGCIVIQRTTGCIYLRWFAAKIFLSFLCCFLNDYRVDLKLSLMITV